MSLLSDLVTETQRRALSGLREETSLLGESTVAGATSLSLQSGQTLGAIQAGAIVEIDYELFFVTAAASPQSITVTPGYEGSTEAAHTAGALVRVNPRFPAVDVIRAINEEIDALSSPTNGLYQMLEVTLTYSPVLVGYDLTDTVTGQPVDPDSIIDIWQVRAHDYGPYQAWPVIPPHAYKLQRNADTTVFPSGLALELYQPGFPGRPLRVQYKARYATPLVGPGDDVQAVTGLQPTAHDIPVIGAAYRLMNWRELKRSFSEAQGEPRRAQEVPVGASLTAMKGLQQLRHDRIDGERARLDRQYPRTWR